MLTGLLSAAVAADASSKPHILFVLVDDLGFGNVGFNRAHSPTGNSTEVNTGLGDPCSDNTGIPQNMTGLAEHLKHQGYVTAMAGKWDAGMATPAHTPHGRGYDTSLNYFSHKNDFWSQANMQTCCESDQTIVDFWHTDKGASNLNSTDYSEFLYQKELLGVIEKHDASKPLMLFYAPHVAHCPLQVPKAYYENFGFMTDDEDLDYKCRQQYHAMVSIMDEVVGNLTNALKRKNMWENTLVVFSSDNGGPVDLAENAANNWPLRGGKYSVFEGGIRVAAFVSGGLVPAQLRGSTNNGIVHIADWYGTLVTLAGGDPTDTRAAASGLPPIDSVDVWPFLVDVSGATKSPRSGFPVDTNCVVDGAWKLITSNTQPSTWQGPKFPNATSRLDGYRHSEYIGADDDGYAVSAPPPRPYPRLEPCDGGANKTLAASQKWAFSSMKTVCTEYAAFSGSNCWNVQASQSRLILWPKETASNSEFSISTSGGLLHSELQKAGKNQCVGASGVGGELTIADCSAMRAGNSMVTQGWAYDTKSGQVSVQVESQKLCVTAYLNGTDPKPPHSGGPCANGCLFNVETDPTEQRNVYSENPDIVANLSARLLVYTGKFFKNNDKFTNDCDPGTKKCACELAKTKYSGFLGPYAMTKMDSRRGL